MLCVCLYDEAQIRAFLEKEAVFASMKRNSVFVVFSTVSPRFMRKLQEEAASHEVIVLGAPVSGAQVIAAEGTLSVMVSGDSDAHESLRSVWDAVGSEVFWLGADVGAGQLAKVCNNIVSLSVNLIKNEVVRVAKHGGINAQDILSVLGAGSGDSWIVQNWGILDAQLVNHSHGGSLGR